MGSIAGQNLRAISLADGLGLRPAQAADEAFMEALFRSTREHFYSMPLPRQHIDLLLAQQYRLQQASYAQKWPQARNIIIELSGQAIGKIMLDEGAAAVHIIDLIFESGMRGKGYGTKVLQVLQTATGARRVSLSVDRQNPGARKLYLRLGFAVDAVSETHESMSWAPPTAAVLQNNSGLYAKVFHKQTTLEE